MEGKLIPEVGSVGECQFGPQMLEYTVKLVNAHREQLGALVGLSAPEEFADDLFLSVQGSDSSYLSSLTKLIAIIIFAPGIVAGDAGLLSGYRKLVAKRSAPSEQECETFVDMFADVMGRSFGIRAHIDAQLFAYQLFVYFSGPFKQLCDGSMVAQEQKFFEALSGAVQSAQVQKNEEVEETGNV